jgi:hypothetical protein
MADDDEELDRRLCPSCGADIGEMLRKSYRDFVIRVTLTQMVGGGVIVGVAVGVGVHQVLSTMPLWASLPASAAAGVFFGGIIVAMAWALRQLDQPGRLMLARLQRDHDRREAAAAKAREEKLEEMARFAASVRPESEHPPDGV